MLPSSSPALPDRRSLPHEVPAWVKPGSLFLITLCCAPRGENQLCTTKTANSIFESIRHHNEIQAWYAHLVLLMPDHLHALIAFPADRPMSTTIRNWKRVLSRTDHIQWQRDFFDHRIRNDESWEEKAAHIRLNPVRAGLVNDASKWQYIWERK
jgi:putative transposase